MKKIYFGLLLVIVVGTYLFILGIFHPKVIYIDDLKIKAPEDMILSNVTVDYNKNVYNYFSPLLLQHQNKYNLSDNQNISFHFSGSNKLAKTPSILVRLSSNFKQNKFLEIYENKNNYKMQKSKNCLIYLNNIENIIEAHAFYIEKKAMISLYSSEQKEINYILQQFCPNISP